MILIQLNLQNIRSYHSAVIRFPKGNILLAGDIGSGKSSILLSIEFALFGSKRSQLAGTSLLRNGETSGSVELTAEIDKKEVIIKRTLKRQNNSVRQGTGHIIIDGVKQEGTPQELKSKVLELLGYPAELISKSSDLIFRYTVYTPQEQMKQIILDDSELRVDTLRKVFQIDKYKTIRDSGKIINTQLTSNIKELKIRSENLEQLQKSRGENQLEIEQLEKKIQNVSHALKVCQEKLNTEKEMYESLRKELELLQQKLLQKEQKEKELIAKKNTSAELTENIKTVENKIQLLEEEIKTIALPEVDSIPLDILGKKKEELGKKIQDHDESFALLEKEKEQREKNLQELRKELDSYSNLSKQKEELEKSIIQLTEQLKEKETIEEKGKQLHLMSEQLSNERTRILQLQEQAVDIQRKITTLSDCPTCLQHVPSDHKEQVIHQHKVKQEAAELRLQSLQTKDDQIKKEILDNTQKTAVIQESEKKYAQSSAQLEALHKEIASLEQKKEKVDMLKNEEQKVLERLEELNKQDTTLWKEELKNTEEQIMNTAKVDEIKKRKVMLEIQIQEEHVRVKTLKEKVKELTVHQETLARECSELGKAVIESEHIKEKTNQHHAILESIQEEEKTLIANIATVTATKEAKIKENAQLDAQIEKMESDRKRILKKTKLHTWLNDFFIPLMETMEKQVMLSLYTEFNELFVNWFSMLIEDESLMVRLDETFSPVIEQDGYETTVENLSGGEKTALALAYRLALNKAINDFVSHIKTKDLIILDEPTDGFSTHQLDRIRDVMEELDAEQVIIVSHETKIESFVEHVLRISKHEHASQVNS